ncbi:MAG: hypothetical protein CMD32_02965 [Flavobacteriales bacterium]|nr:hypothetical protein [Flavobacteriales bacterium]
MIIEQKNKIIYFKNPNFNFIKSLDLISFKKKYNNYDVILEINFSITSDLIRIIFNWNEVLQKNNRVLINVVQSMNKLSGINESLIFVPTYHEAIDFIELEKINRDLSFNL